MGTRNLFADKLKAFGIFFVFVAIFCEILCGQESGSAVDDEKRTVIVFLVGQSNIQGHGAYSMVFTCPLALVHY